MGSYCSNENSRFAYESDMLGELLVCNYGESYEDFYVIRFEYDHSVGRSVLKSFYLSSDSARMREVSYFPMRLSAIYSKRESSTHWESFYKQLDHELVKELLAAKLDDLNAYAIIDRHPDLRGFVENPIAIVLAMSKRGLFEKMVADRIHDFKAWIPKIIGIDKRLGKGNSKLLARLNCVDQEAAIKAAKIIVRDFEMLHRFIPARMEISAEAVLHLRRVIELAPKLRSARWLSIRYTSSLEHSELILDLFRDTRSLLLLANVNGIDRILLKQTKSVDGLLRLHDRYSRRNAIRQLDPKASLNTHGMTDIPHFKLVRTVGELNRIAAKFRNCAAIYCQAGIDGRYVHWLYDNSEEIALLQLDFSDPLNPVRTQFYGPRNTLVSSQAAYFADKLIHGIASQMRHTGKS